MLPLYMTRREVDIPEGGRAPDAREVGPHVLQHNVNPDAGLGRDKVTVTLVAFMRQLRVNLLSFLDFFLSCVFVFSIFSVEVFIMDHAVVFVLLIIFKVLVTISTTQAANQGLIIVMITLYMLKNVFNILTFKATILTIKLRTKVTPFDVKLNILKNVT